METIELLFLFYDEFYHTYDTLYQAGVRKWTIGVRVMY